MPSIKRESDIEREFVRGEEANGAMCLKFAVPGRPGFPDRMTLEPMDHAVRALRERFPRMPESRARDIVQLVRDSSVRFTELKVARGRFEPRQRRVLGLLRGLGFNTTVKGKQE